MGVSRKVCVASLETAGKDKKNDIQIVSTGQNMNQLTSKSGHCVMDLSKTFGTNFGMGIEWLNSLGLVNNKKRRCIAHGYTV